MTDAEKLILDELIVIVDDIVEFMADHIEGHKQFDRLSWFQTSLRKIRTQLK